MSEWCVDASIAVKWAVAGEPFRAKLFYDAVKATFPFVKYLPGYPEPLPPAQLIDQKNE